MILVADIGNTSLVLGAMAAGKVHHVARLATIPGLDEAQLEQRVREALSSFGVQPGEWAGCVLSSVVPQLTPKLCSVLARLTRHEVMVVGSPDIKTGLPLAVDNPSAVGHDRIADTVGALSKHDAPLIVVDMGTATTLNVVDGHGRFIGGIIAPGVQTSLQALTGRTAQLPEVPLLAPAHIIGGNTSDCLRSGIIYGHACMVDGLIARLSAQFPVAPRAITTGGFSPLIIPHCHQPIIHEPHLLLEGLHAIYRLNR